LRGGMTGTALDLARTPSTAIRDRGGEVWVGGAFRQGYQRVDAAPTAARPQDVWLAEMQPQR
jgi:hypothetical protein